MYFMTSQAQLVLENIQHIIEMCQQYLCSDALYYHILSVIILNVHK